MRFGNLTLHFVSDGTTWQDGGGLFGLVPRVLWKRVVEPDDHNRIPVELRSLLIESDEQCILIDTGCGDKRAEQAQVGLTGKNRLLNSLEKLGISPLDVDLVINTHLHGNHCGGNTRHDENGDLAPTFPWATYCVQRLELADASFPNERTRTTYHREHWEPLERAGQIRVLSGNSRLTDEIRVIVTPGHTQAHQCIVIESGGRTAIFLGDVASWPIHMERLAWVPAYDVEPLVSIETKRDLARWAVESHALLLFQHHPEILAGYLHPTERPDRFRLEPVEIDD